MKPGVRPEHFEELRAQAQRCLIDFLDAEIQLGFTFVEAAAYERKLGQTEHSRHTRDEASKAVASIHHFLDRISNPKIRQAIAGRCAELDHAVAAL